MITIPDLARLREYIGCEVGTSDWVAVTQERINAFADATGDHQWIHVDRERAANESPYQTTIAHGFLTLSLISALMRNAIAIGGMRMAINYGANRVRFAAPVPANSRIRARIVLAALADVNDAVQATWNITVEREQSDKPCLVAEWLVRYYPDAAH